MGCGFEWNWWSCVGVGVGGGCRLARCVVGLVSFGNGGN